MRSPWSKTALALIVVAAVAGCNSSQKTAGVISRLLDSRDTPCNYHPCVLVTKTDAEAILGEGIIYDKTENVFDIKACAYAGTSKTKIVEIFLTPRISRGADLWHGMKLGAKGAMQPVSGLGKEAFFGPEGLGVLTSNCILKIKVYGFKEETQNADAEKAFALKALARM